MRYKLAYKQPKQSYPEEDLDIIERYVYNRIIKKNRNFVCIFNGDTGSGKSYASLKFALNLSKMFNTRFDIRENIAFNFDDLIQNIYSNTERSKGYVYIFEEPGAIGSGGSSMEWQSKGNRALNTFLQTMRCKNQILIFNCPSFFDISSQARKRMHFQFESLHINPAKKRSYWKPLQLYSKMNKKKQKDQIYYNYIKYINQDSIKKKFRKKAFLLPEPDIIKEYEQYKQEYTDRTMEVLKNHNVNEKKSKLKDVAVRMIKSGLEKQQVIQLAGITERYWQMINKELNERNSPAVT